jgi:hypothetical protein
MRLEGAKEGKERVERGEKKLQEKDERVDGRRGNESTKGQ